MKKLSPPNTPAKATQLTAATLTAVRGGREQKVFYKVELIGR